MRVLRYLRGKIDVDLSYKTRESLDLWGYICRHIYLCNVNCKGEKPLYLSQYKLGECKRERPYL